MPSLISCAQAGFEPIQGYVLREKLGAGGYGEFGWRTLLADSRKLLSSSSDRSMNREPTAN